jgi:hypothetical protein
MRWSLKFITGLLAIVILVSCASSKSHHKKLDPKKRIPCPHKDC